MQCVRWLIQGLALLYGNKTIISVVFFLSRTTQRGEIDFLLQPERYTLSDLVAKQCYFTITAKKTVPGRVWKYEDQYRGREFPGFSNYKTFEDIIKEQIRELEHPAVQILNNVMSMAQGGLLCGGHWQVYFPGESLTDALRILQSVEVNLIQLGDCSFCTFVNTFVKCLQHLLILFPVAFGRELENSCIINNTARKQYSRSI